MTDDLGSRIAEVLSERCPELHDLLLQTLGYRSTDDPREPIFRELAALMRAEREAGAVEERERCYRLCMSRVALFERYLRDTGEDRWSDWRSGAWQCAEDIVTARPQKPRKDPTT